MFISSRLPATYANGWRSITATLFYDAESKERVVTSTFYSEPKLMRRFGFPLFVHILVLITPCLTTAQQQIASVAHFRHTIASNTLGEERTILVRVPPGYERSTQRFHVVLMLDAHAPQNGMMAGIIESQAFAGTMPEMILVGI